MALIRILANGFPKSGTHALVKAIALLGHEVQHSHTPYGDDVSEYSHHVFIRRDPRNVILSKVRSEGQRITQGMVIGKIRRWNDNDEPFAQVLARYAPWLTQAPLVIRYEELIADESVLKLIAKYLGVPYLGDAFRNLPGTTRTWNPEHSDYRVVWTPEVDAVWREQGGAAILQEWGYV